MPSKLIVALDFPSSEQALAFVGRLSPDTCKLKVGFELFVSAGPDMVKKLMDMGFDIFLDLKFHDIPNTVASACEAASTLGVWMLNVHASGGDKMLQAAREAVSKVAKPPKLIAVTVLTSMDEMQLNGIGLQTEPQEQVIRLASLVKQAELDGVVCSAKEAAMLREHLGQEFLLVTPGIRPAGSDKGDQKRIMTPADAVKAGASYLVVGRPITQADDPCRVIEKINRDTLA
jgi:orotidine-5'-phosphate decarboxylase